MDDYVAGPVEPVTPPVEDSGAKRRRALILAGVGLVLVIASVLAILQATRDDEVATTERCFGALGAREVSCDSPQAEYRVLKGPVPQSECDQGSVLSRKGEDPPGTVWCVEVLQPPPAPTGAADCADDTGRFQACESDLAKLRKLDGQLDAPACVERGGRLWRASTSDDGLGDCYVGK